MADHVLGQLRTHHSVDTSKLLENHDPAADCQSLKHMRSKQCSQRPLPSLPLLEFEVDLLVKHHRGLDLQVFRPEKRILRAQPAEAAQGGNGIIIAMLHHQPARRERQEEHAEEENPGGN